MAEAETVEEPEFRWERKSKTKNKNIRFYDSFVYDNVKYLRYDCVYLYEEGVEEPYIGKLIKMWETVDKQKKGKVLWFFQPSEISNFIGDDETLENELFLASGEGSGLANVAPLEAIAGKCNVVCISKDSRNRQPTDQEIANAEYVFRRTFDVGSCKIKDEMGETISGIDVKLLLNNKAYVGEDCNTLKVDLGSKEIDKNALENIGSVVASGNVNKECEAVKTNGHCNGIATKEAADLNNLLTKPEPSTRGMTAAGPRDDEKGNKEKANPAELKRKRESSTTEKTVPDACKKQDETAKANEPKENVSSRKDLSRSNVKPKNSETVKVKRADSVELDDRPSKKAKLSSDANGQESIAPSDFAANEDEVKPPKDSSEIEKGPLKRLKRGDKSTGACNGKLPKVCTQQADDEDCKKEEQQSEGTPKPDTDRSKWFGGLPWEDRLRNAHQKGTLVLLENLDPTFSSAEVEDIVRQGFDERCSAKMIPQTAYSSPHSGQAFVIFEKKEVAKMVIERLDKDCLLLPNGRPLLARRVTPCFPEKKPVFSGHLCIEKLRYLMQRDQKDAVSTSHCAYPNTIEYELSMEWLLLHSQSDMEWKKLNELQLRELRELKVPVKAKLRL